MGFPDGSEVKASASNAGDLSSIPGSGRSLEKEMATYSSILAWEIPWIEKPGGLQSMGSQESCVIVICFVIVFTTSSLFCLEGPERLSEYLT